MARKKQPRVHPSEPRFEGEASPSERRAYLQALANIALFENAENETVERLVRSCTFRTYSKGQKIIDEHEPPTHVHFLLRGTVRVFQSNTTGGQYAPKVFCAPTHFGDLGALSFLQRNGSSAEALDEVVTGALDNQEIRMALSNDHGLCLAWLYSVARQHSVTIDSDRQNVFGGVIARTANVLLSLADVFGIDDQNMRAIDLELSYSKIALQVGCSRRSAIAVMQRLQQRGLVIRSGEFWLVDVSRLREELLPGHLSLAHSFLDIDEKS